MRTTSEPIIERPGMPGVYEVPLQRFGLVALVDKKDLPKVGAHVWTAEIGTHTIYAVRNVGNRLERMHTIICPSPDRRVPDHISGIGIDNRRANLRLITRSANNINREKRTGTSVYPGVYWHAQRAAWTARLKVNGKTLFLGRFADERDAAMAYVRATEQQFGKVLRKEKPEAIVSRQVRQFLEIRHWRIIRNNVTKFPSAGGKWVQVGEPGMPDFQAIKYLDATGVCVSFWVEIKRPGGKRKQHQIDWHEKESRLGAVVLTTDSIDEFADTYEQRFGWLHSGRFAKAAHQMRLGS